MAIIEDIQAFMTGSFDYVSVVLYYGLVIIGLFLFYKIVSLIFKRLLFRFAKTKRERSNAIIFLHLWRYVFILITLIVLIFAYTGSLEGLGLSAALLTAAMGWALQRPISGIAGWLMVIISKPFRIGDRISVDKVRGDVVNITLTHIYIGEIGGTTGSDEPSGRVVLVPNSKLFESDIINYTLMDDYVTDEVSVIITFDSNLEKAKNIWIQSAKTATKGFETEEKPEIFTYFSNNGIKLTVRFKTMAEKRERVKSDITNTIYNEVSKVKDVRFAYPHTEVILKKNSRKKA